MIFMILISKTKLGLQTLKFIFHLIKKIKVNLAA